MDDLGLDALTDDQLVGLARAVGAEINRRNPAVADAARQAIIEEIEKAKDNADDVWAAKKRVAVQVADALGKGWHLSTWLAGDRRESRVYLERHADRTSVVYYATGSKSVPPGHVVVTARRGVEKPDERVVRYISEAALAAFPEGVRMSCDQAVETAYPATSPADLLDLVSEVDRERRRKRTVDEATAAIFAEYRAERGRQSLRSKVSQDDRDRLDALLSKAEAELAKAMHLYDTQEDPL